MAISYDSRAIYNKSPSKLIAYVALLICSKFLKAFGLYMTYDLLKLIHVILFLFIVKSGASVLLVFLQKPFTSGPRLTRHQWFRVGRAALFESCIQLLWLFGLTLCGPFRTILLFEHSDIVVVAGLTALFTLEGGGPSKLRGAVFFVIAVIGILLFDHDDFDQHQGDYHPEGHHSSIITHLFYHFINLSGLSDHKGGVVLLTATLCLRIGYSTASKKLSVDIGGAKRLNALTMLVSSVLLAPWAGFIYFTREETPISSWLHIILPIVVVILLVFVLDYYVDAVSVNRLDCHRTSKIGSLAIFLSGLLLTCFWNHPYITSITAMHKVKEIFTEEHILSGGVIFSLILFMFSTTILSSPSKGNRGTFIGYSSAGLPLYKVTGDAMNKTSHVLHILHTGLRSILEESDSRRIFYFLCINLAFTFVELLYGAWTNSLGLISDGFHMLFDCSALVMGLYAAVMSKWKATRIFSYGYDRIEILSGYINGLFLVVIGFFVFTSALARLYDPPTINTERLLVVSVAGLLVNLVGISAFSHGHSHGGGGHSHGGGGHSHGGGGHSHSGASHGHSHSGHTHGAHSHSNSTTHNTNMQGVFLHVLADTLGSVGVIISTILIENFGWNISDPICSLFIATMILLSVLPLLKETASMLVLRIPPGLETNIALTLQKILAIEGIVSFRDDHFWKHSNNCTCGTLHIQVTPTTSELKIVSQVSSIFKEVGVQNLSIQVEKEAYFQHMSGLCVNFKKEKNNREILACGVDFPEAIKMV